MRNSILNRGNFATYIELVFNGQTSSIPCLKYFLSTHLLHNFVTIQKSKREVSELKCNLLHFNPANKSVLIQFLNIFKGGKLLLFSLAVFCLLPIVGYSQYDNDFEGLQGSATGVILTNQAGFEKTESGIADFNVYTYNGNDLGIIQNPMGNSKFIAGIGPGPNMTKSANTRRIISFGSGGVWAISYDLAVTLLGSSTTGLEAIGMFQITNREQGSDASAYFRNWLKWIGEGAGGYPAPEPFNVGYFGFNEFGRNFSFYGDNPGQEWDHLSFNHWYRVTTIIDFDTNQILQFGITDLHSGRRKTFTSLSNIFLNGGALVPPGSTCTQRSATPSSTGECYLLPNSFSMYVYNEHTYGGKNVLAFDNINIVPSSNPRDLGYIYDNGPARGSGGSAIGHAISADDFKLNSDGIIPTISIDVWDGPMSENRTWDGTIEWWIFSDNAGSPGNVVASGNALNSFVHNMTSPSNTSYRNYTIDFNLDRDVQLQGGVTYWLGLHLQRDYNRVSVSWEYTRPFDSDLDGDPPTNYTFIARSGGQLVNGVPNFPTPLALSKELAFRFIPKRRCYTLFGRTVCLERMFLRRALSIAEIIAGVTIFVIGLGIWRKYRAQNHSNLIS